MILPNHRFAYAWTVLTVVLWLSLSSLLTESAVAQTYATLEEASQDLDFALQGEYLSESGGWQVVALGAGRFSLVSYPGGLPGAGWTGGNRQQVEVGVAELQKLLDSAKQVERKSPTLDANPPTGAIHLFDGRQESLKRYWDAAAKMSDEGFLQQGCTTSDQFGDYKLHLEFRTPYKPKARGQQRGNSGVYHQGRYETQVLDSFGLDGKNNETGGIYETHDPDLNMCLPPLTWQTYDVDFTAARYDDNGKKLTNARMTVRLNDVVVQRDVEIPKATRGATLKEGPEHGPIFLQDHKNPVCYRNIWILPRTEAADSAAPTSLPNVIILLSDDQGWADIGYNNPKVYTPNLDRLAKTGATFTNHYVMPQCTPTRVALMTGRYPGRFGDHALQATNEPCFPIGTPTIASMFQQLGYDTSLCGKWHLGSSSAHGPNHFGFNESYGSLTGAVGMYDHRYREGQFYETWHRDGNLIEGSENGVHATDLITEEAIKFIQRKRASRKPFFLYVPFHAVHTPLDERGEFVDRPTQLDPKNPERWLNEDGIQWFNDPDGKIQSEPDPEKRLLLATAYHMDDAIGKLVSAVDASGQRENTLILFSSDNGPQGSWGGNAYPDDLKLTKFNQPLPMRGKKTDVWEGGIHVPGFANWPGRIDANEISDPVHIIDWFPTLANLIGYETSEDPDWDGADISPAMLTGKKLAERDLYWIWNQKTKRWALQFGDWKIVKYGAGEPSEADWQLFNLQSDPNEKSNIAGQFPGTVTRLHQMFLAQRGQDQR